MLLLICVTKSSLLELCKDGKQKKKKKKKKDVLKAKRLVNGARLVEYNNQNNSG